MNSKISGIIQNSSFISLVIFVAAFIPRIVAPDQFLTADEFLWVDRSRNFLAGLLNEEYQCTTVVEKWEFAQGLACTLRTGHPGVTTMWTGSFGLWLSWLAQGSRLPLYDFIVSVSTNPMDAFLITPSRVGTILISSIWVVAVYWLTRRLFGSLVALVGAVIIALDPFHIALSRVIHHDALSTTFITLSVLTALVYWGERERKKWLIASGLMAGFGFLSKSPALYLLPFIAVTGLWLTIAAIWYQMKGGNSAPLMPTASRLLLRTVLDGLLWFAVSLLVVFIFWPAMWAVPLEAIETVFLIGSKYATGGHAKGNFFLGEISKDPGALFYPVTWLYRASPLVVVGVIIALIGWPLHQYFRPSPDQKEKISETGDSARNGHGLFYYLPIFLVFILGYYLLMTLGEKKQDRYFLPVYPWLDLIAAGGLVSVVNYLFPFNESRVAYYASSGTLLLLTVIINGYLVISSFPYYFTYYNPLLGGIKGAAQVLTIGWGEGLDLAADYVNHLYGPGRNRVASWYESTFAPYYYGPTISYSKEKGKALAGDYVIFYINQTQRQFPDEIFFEYFESRFEPEHTVTLQGLDYAWIYPSLGIDHYVQDQTYTGIASLLAWQWRLPDQPLISGENAWFDLFWEYLGKLPDEPFFFRLVDAQNRTWAEAVSQPEGNPPFETWREGEIIHEVGILRLPEDIPSGQYRLQIGILTRAPAVKSGELMFILPPDETLVTVGHHAPVYFNLPEEAIPLRKPLGDALTLLGGVLPRQAVKVGGKIPLDLYWHVTRPLSAQAALHVGLMDQAGEARQAWFNLSLAETLNPAETTWQPGALMRTRWELELLPETPPGEYQLELVWPDDTNQFLSVGQLDIQALQP